MEMGEEAAVVAGGTAKAKPRIEAVAFLEGADTTELPGGGKQFVNLPRAAKWVDNTHVTTLDRLGMKTRIKVRFSEAGAYGFKLKFKTGATNTVYSGGEKGRNTHFKFEDAEKSYTTGGDGTKIIESDFFVAAAGKDTYEVVAKDDDGNEVMSTTLTTYRLAYYVELKMQGLTAVATSLNTFISEFARHNIQLVGLASVDMNSMPNVSNTAADNAAFLAKARTAYLGSTAPAKQPYVIAIAYTDHLAVKDPDQRLQKAGVDVGPGKPDVEIPVVDSSIVPAEQKYLWHNLVPGEGWFVSASFLKHGGAAGTDTVNILEADCTAVPLNTLNPNLLTKVKIKVSGMAAATGTITLRVNWVNRMRGGLSMSDNIICVCTRAWWQDINTASQNQVMIHETGHQVKMVADGSGTGPDKVSTQYTGKGHIGPHCHEGLPVQASYATSNGSCVMFGATSSVTAFCANCAPAVVKQDLSSGWTAF